MSNTRNIMIGPEPSVRCANPKCRELMPLMGSSSVLIDQKEYPICQTCILLPFAELRKLIKESPDVVD